MDDQNQLLVSDADRERSVASLRDDLLAGRLTLEEATAQLKTVTPEWYAVAKAFFS